MTKRPLQSSLPVVLNLSHTFVVKKFNHIKDPNRAMSLARRTRNRFGMSTIRNAKADASAASPPPRDFLCHVSVLKGYKFWGSSMFQATSRRPSSVKPIQHYLQILLRICLPLKFGLVGLPYCKNNHIAHIHNPHSNRCAEFLEMAN